MKLEINLHHPLTENQKRVMKSRKDHLLVQGPAGTAKTYSVLARGLVKISAGEVDQIIIVRSPVEIRKIGHLPGDADEKMDPYAAPYIGLLAEISPKMNYRALVSKRLLTFTPTTFLRGTTFHDAFVIVDEYQNLSEHELETVMTRVGSNTQLCVVGDPTGQSDLPKHEQGEQAEIIDTFASMAAVEHVQFDIADIVRSGFVKDFYTARAERSGGLALPDRLFGSRPRLTVAA
jgi:phosphate starvation-inducible protein PhoH